MFCVVFLTLVPNFLAPVFFEDNDPFRHAMIAAIHQFAAEGELDHLKAIVGRYPELINERQTFRQPHKPLSTDGYSPLHHAAAYNRDEIVAWLLEKGADANVSDGAGWTSLHVAARAGNLSIVKLLVKYDAITDAETVAIPEKFEIPPGSPPGAKPQRFPAVPARTPLDVAEQFKKADVAKFLRSVKK